MAWAGGSAAGGVAAAIEEEKRKKGERSRKWECVQVNHHGNVGKTIEEWEMKGWCLHTYSAAQLRGSEINHYLLFEREDV